MQRLFQRQGAGRPPRVRWTLEEVGASYDYVVMEQEEGRGPEHAKRHPLGRVPVLETDEGLLFESAALCLHIADSHPEAQLIPPPGTHLRALVYQWAFFAMTELEPAVLRLWTARRGDDTEALASAEAKIAKVARALEEGLNGGTYLISDRFTVADIIVGGVLESARKYGVFPDSAPLLAYLEGLDERPAKQRAYA
jgi:glutathione S-transferase